MLRVVLLDVIDPRVSQQEAGVRQQELESLVATYGGVVVVASMQKKQVPDYQTYVGSGKLTTIIELMIDQQADVLIIGNILKPRQLYQVNERLRIAAKKGGHEMQAWDRVDLILKIFDLHASTAEAKMQIELAAIKHMGPRIFGMGMELSRQGAGIGTKGIGETNTEIMKRHLKERLRVIQKKLEEYNDMRQYARDRRKRNNFFTVGIVGYTNAGKSSLFNVMGKKQVLAEDKLFATLGTTASKIFLPRGEEGKGVEILLHDTIGFIRDLPPQLIQAFRSTLEDSLQTDILLHVLDISDPQWLQKIDIVDNILAEINATQPRILVCNKIDKLSEMEQQRVLAVLAQKVTNTIYIHDDNALYTYKDYILFSAHTKVGIDTLTQLILQFIE